MAGALPSRETSAGLECDAARLEAWLSGRIDDMHRIYGAVSIMG